MHPKEVKSAFAREIITRYHSKEDAAAAMEHFEKVFARKETPDVIPEFHHKLEGGEIWLPKLLAEIGFAASTSEGKRLVAQGAVKIDETPAAGEKYTPGAGKSFVIQCGKRKFGKILVN